jgi:hypothetical protein
MANVEKKHSISAELAQKMVDRVVHNGFSRLPLDHGQSGSNPLG